jgi:hypothetical protein
MRVDGAKLLASARESHVTGGDLIGGTIRLISKESAREFGCVLRIEASPRFDSRNYQTLSFPVGSQRIGRRSGFPLPPVCEFPFKVISITFLI